MRVELVGKENERKSEREVRQCNVTHIHTHTQSKMEIHTFEFFSSTSSFVSISGYCSVSDVSSFLHSQIHIQSQSCCCSCTFMFLKLWQWSCFSLSLSIAAAGKT